MLLHSRSSAWKKAAAVLLAAAIFMGLPGPVSGFADDPIPACGMEEHAHTASCYTAGETGGKTQICQPEVHRHNESCRDEAGKLICGRSETLLHTHTEECFDQGTLVCTLEEITTHVHDASCGWDGGYLCGISSEYHVHAEDCRDEAGRYRCAMTEPDSHLHEAGCFAQEEPSEIPLCGIIAHVHTAECTAAAGTAADSVVMDDAAGMQTESGEGEILAMAETYQGLSMSLLGVYAGYNGGLIRVTSTGASPNPGQTYAFSDIPIHRLTGGGLDVTAFCIEPWNPSVSGHVYTQSDTGTAWNGYSADLKRAIAMVLYHGYPNQEIPDWAFANTGSSYRYTVKAAVTQVFLYELCSGLRDPVTFAYNGGIRYFRDAVADQYAYNHTTDRYLVTREFQDAYDYLENRMMNANQIPSFTVRFPGSLSAATAIQLQPAGDGTYQATVTDTNNVLSLFRFEDLNTKEITYTVRGNTLTITATKDALSQLGADKAVRVTGIMCNVDPEKSCLIFRDVNQSNGQNLAALRSAPAADPVLCYLNLAMPGGTIEITKTSSDGSVAGIGFTVADGKGNETAVTTDHTGTATVSGLEDGTYTVAEQIPSGYRGEGPKTVTVTAGQTSAVTFQNEPVTFYLKVTKKVSQNITNIGDASLKGAVYGLYRGETLLEQFTTDENGSFVTGNYPCGTDYTLRELTAPAGFLRDLNVYPIAAGEQSLPAAVNEIALTVEETLIHGGVKIEKHDADSGLLSSGAAATEGTEYAIVYEGKDPIDVRGVTFRNGDTVTVLRTDAFGIAGTDADLLPYGKYSLRETKAPEGYLTDAENHSFSVENDGQIVSFTGSAALREQVIRGNLTLHKTSGETGDNLGGIVFRLTSLTTGESHLLVTDPAGSASTQRTVSAGRVNASDGALQPDGSIDEALLVPDTGIWFFGNAAKQGSIDPQRGALPYDTYRLEELRTSANRDMALLDPVTLEIRENNKVIELGTLVNYDRPWIRTQAADRLTGTSFGTAAQPASLTDTVTYHALDPNTDYLVCGRLMDADTQQPLTDRSGAPVEKQVQWRPETRSGTLEMTFDLSGTELAGRSVVCFETVMLPDGTVVCSHEDFGDEDQTVRYPQLLTMAYGPDSRQEVRATENTTVITDRVTYRNLEPGQTYTLTATVTDTATGQLLTDADGNTLQAVTVFTPGTMSGRIDQKMELPSERIRGKTLVVCETLTAGDREICAHADPDDPDQTVCFPSLRTSAESLEGLKYVYYPAEDPVVTLIDRVTYEGLLPGVEHTLRSALADAVTGELLKNEDGSPVETVTVFTPQSSSGTETVTVTVDQKLADGKTLVVFEELYCGDTLTGSHRDVSDEEQTIRIGKRSKLFKFDASTLKGVPGAELKLTDRTTGETWNLVSDADGNAWFTGIPGHSYAFEETKAPKGYLRDNNEYTFDIREDGTAEGTMTLMNIHGGTIVITKKDVLTGEAVKGAEITVYNEAGLAVFSQSTNEDGKIYFYTEEKGTFTYRETKAPEGYYLSVDTYTFHIAEDLTVKGTLRITNVPAGTAEIRKTDVYGAPLAGAVFTFYNSEGHVLGSATSNEQGRVYFAAKQPGVYTFTETTAPYGYQRREETFTITISADGAPSGDLTILNEKNPSDYVQTGDPSDPLLWCAVLLSTLLAVGLTLTVYGKKRQGENHGRRKKTRS